MQNVTQKSGNENWPKYGRNLGINWKSFNLGCLNVKQASASCQYEVWQQFRASHGYRLTAVLPVICLTAVNRLAFTSGGLTG